MVSGGDLSRDLPIVPSLCQGHPCPRAFASAWQTLSPALQPAPREDCTKPPTFRVTHVHGVCAPRPPPREAPLAALATFCFPHLPDHSCCQTARLTLQPSEARVGCPSLFPNRNYPGPREAPRGRSPGEKAWRSVYRNHPEPPAKPQRCPGTLCDHTACVSRVLPGSAVPLLRVLSPWGPSSAPAGDLPHFGSFFDNRTFQ